MVRKYSQETLRCYHGRRADTRFDPSEAEFRMKAEEWTDDLFIFLFQKGTRRVHEFAARFDASVIEIEQPPLIIGVLVDGRLGHAPLECRVSTDRADPGAGGIDKDDVARELPLLHAPPKNRLYDGNPGSPGSGFEFAEARWIDVYRNDLSLAL